MRETRKTVLNLRLSGETLVIRWQNSAARRRASEQVVERLKRVADSVKEDLIGEIASELEVSLPDTVPSRDRAMTWQQVRACARNGVTFGAHTVTHPILSQVDSARAEREILESWRTVSAETDAAVPVFCYPNGTPADFSSREKRSVASAGMRAALSTVDGSLVSTVSGLEIADRFAIPRFCYAEKKASFVQIASGLEALGRRSPDSGVARSQQIDGDPRHPADQGHG
jgi:peptidoglycan/xylan/chitin deacetylase (PgdA/CDA1 family)